MGIKQIMLVQGPTTAKLEEDLLPFEVGYLPELYKKKAEVELNYTSEMTDKCLQKIKKAIKNDATLNGIRFHDNFLLIFLILRKFDVLKTVSQLKLYVNYRKKNPDVLTSQPFEVLANVMTMKFAAMLPWRCQEGCVLLYVQMANWSPEKHSADILQKYYATSLMQCLRDPMTQVNGFKVILDMNINPLVHIKLCTPQNLYRFYYGTMVAFPGRFKGIHLVNLNLAGRMIWRMTKIFMSEKMKNRVHLHSSYDTLLDFFPRAVLPIEFGGDLKDYDMSEWLRKYTSPDELAFWDGTF